MEPSHATVPTEQDTGYHARAIHATPMLEKPTVAALFASEEGALLRFAYGLVGRREVAEEAVQEGFLRLHEHWTTVENPRAWLYRAVRNLALNHLRKYKRENVTGDLDGHTSEAPVPDEELGRHEAAGMVRLLMADLKDDDRQLLHLKYHEELAYGKIAERLGLSVGNVGYRLHHLLKNLADSLRSAGVEGSSG